MTNARTKHENTCDECGLPISICNAKAMFEMAVSRNGREAVIAAILDAKTEQIEQPTPEAMARLGEAQAENERLRTENESLTLERDHFEAEVKLRNRIPSMNDYAARMQADNERLRAENNKLRDDMSGGSFYQEDDIDAMQNEIERLRAALRPFAAAADDYCDPAYDDDYSPQWAEFFVVRDFRIARAALST